MGPPGKLEFYLPLTHPLLCEKIFPTQAFFHPVLSRCSFHRNCSFLSLASFFWFAQIKHHFPISYCGFCTVAWIFHPSKPPSTLPYEKSWTLEFSRPGSKHHFYLLLVCILLNLILWASFSSSRQWNSFVG